jgi:hypothetical protein
MLRKLPMESERSLFSRSNLRSFLETFGRHMTTLRDAKSTGIILRHDVDLELVPVERLAELEEAAGVRSSFFFLTTAETYNVRSSSGRRVLRKLADTGFEVALHFDPTVYPGASDAELAAFARREATILEDTCGMQITSLSLHNPTLLGRFPLIDGFRNAYDPAVFSKDCYLSDSGMRFRSDPFTFFGKADTTLMQLLLHPIHYTESGNGYPTQMVDYVQRQAQLVHEAFLPSVIYQASAAKAFFPALRAAASTWEAESSGATK